jgi:tetratricopeptide (TPR) repeat protein
MNRRAKFILIAIFTMAASTGIAREGQTATSAKPTAESHYDKGMKAYTLGHFPEAIEEFEKAYEMRSEPIFLYNIAQSHRQNNAPQRAIFFYRRYLEADPTVKNRAEIEKRIKDMETQLNAQKEKEHAGAAMTNAPAPATQPQPQQTTAAPPVLQQPDPAAQPAPAQTATVQTMQPTPTEDTHQGRGLRIAGIATAGVGVAAVVTGIAFGLHASSLQSEAYKGIYNDSKLQDSKSFRTLEWVSFGIGGAAVITGGALYYLGLSAKDAPIAIAPIIAPGAGGATVFGTF